MAKYIGLLFGLLALFIFVPAAFAAEAPAQLAGAECPDAPVIYGYSPASGSVLEKGSTQYFSVEYSSCSVSRVILYISAMDHQIEVSNCPSGDHQSCGINVNLNDLPPETSNFQFYFVITDEAGHYTVPPLTRHVEIDSSADYSYEFYEFGEDFPAAYDTIGPEGFASTGGYVPYLFSYKDKGPIFIDGLDYDWYEQFKVSLPNIKSLRDNKDTKVADKYDEIFLEVQGNTLEYKLTFTDPVPADKLAGKKIMFFGKEYTVVSGRINDNLKLAACDAELILTPYNPVRIVGGTVVSFEEVLVSNVTGEYFAGLSVTNGDVTETKYIAVGKSEIIAGVEVYVKNAVRSLLDPSTAEVQLVVGSGIMTLEDGGYLTLGDGTETPWQITLHGDATNLNFDYISVKDTEPHTTIVATNTVLYPGDSITPPNGLLSMTSTGLTDSSGGEPVFMDADVSASTLDLNADGIAERVIRVRTPDQDGLVVASYENENRVEYSTDSIWFNIETGMQAIYFKDPASEVLSFKKALWEGGDPEAQLVLKDGKRMHVYYFSLLDILYHGDGPEELNYKGLLLLLEPQLETSGKQSGFIVEYDGAANGNLGSFKDVYNSDTVPEGQSSDNEACYIYYVTDENTESGPVCDINTFIARETAPDGEPTARDYYSRWGTYVDSAGPGLLSLQIPVKQLFSEYFIGTLRDPAGNANTIYLSDAKGAVPIINYFVADPSSGINLNNPASLEAYVTDNDFDLQSVTLGIADTNKLVSADQTILSFFVDESGANKVYSTQEYPGPWDGTATYLTDGKTFSLATMLQSSSTLDFKFLLGKFQPSGSDEWKSGIAAFDLSGQFYGIHITADAAVDNSNSNTVDVGELLVENGTFIAMKAVSSPVENQDPIWVEGSSFSIYDEFNQSLNPYLMDLPVPTGAYSAFVNAIDQAGNMVSMTAKLSVEPIPSDLSIRVIGTDGKPASYAHVLVIKKDTYFWDTGAQVDGSTNSEGMFYSSVSSGNYTIAVNYVGPEHYVNGYYVQQGSFYMLKDDVAFVEGTPKEVVFDASKGTVPITFKVTGVDESDTDTLDIRLLPSSIADKVRWPQYIGWFNPSRGVTVAVSPGSYSVYAWDYTKYHLASFGEDLTHPRTVTIDASPASTATLFIDFVDGSYYNLPRYSFNLENKNDVIWSRWFGNFKDGVSKLVVSPGDYAYGSTIQLDETLDSTNGVRWNYHFASESKFEAGKTYMLFYGGKFKLVTKLNAYQFDVSATGKRVKVTLDLTDSFGNKLDYVYQYLYKISNINMNLVLDESASPDLTEESGDVLGFAKLSETSGVQVINLGNGTEDLVPITFSSENDGISALSSISSADAGDGIAVGGGGGGGGQPVYELTMGGGQPVYELTMGNYNNVYTAFPGLETVGSYSIYVYNSGSASLQGIGLEIQGIPKEWYSYNVISTERLTEDLSSGESVYFEFKFKPSADAAKKIYPINITARDSEGKAAATEYAALLVTAPPKVKIVKPNGQVLYEQNIISNYNPEDGVQVTVPYNSDPGVYMVYITAGTGSYNNEIYSNTKFYVGKAGDSDGDGIPDEIDVIQGGKVIGDSLELSNGYKIKINNQWDSNRVFEDEQKVEITTVSGDVVVEFSHDFSSGKLDLSPVFSLVDDNTNRGAALVKGIILGDDVTKTIFVSKVSGNGSVCIKDADINSIGEISASCNAADEYVVKCDGLATANGYTCTDIGGKYMISGLKHSGIREIYTEKPVSRPPTEVITNTGGGGGGGGGSVPQKKKVVATEAPKTEAPAPAEPAYVPATEQNAQQPALDTELAGPTGLFTFARISKISSIVIACLLVVSLVIFKVKDTQTVRNLFTRAHVKTTGAGAAVPKVRVTARMQDLLKTLDDREREIMKFLINNNGKTTQARVHHACQIPRSSLSKRMAVLRQRNLIDVSERGKINDIQLSKWFLQGEAEANKNQNN